MNSITQVYFSPGGTTRQISRLFCKNFEVPFQEIDLLKHKEIKPAKFGPLDFVVVSMPVFSGRIPLVCQKQLEALSASNTPAVIIAVYGNREYEDALVEMADILSARGFVLIGAAAFIARHSIIQEVAKGRPDQKDKKLIDDFAKACTSKLEDGNLLMLQSIPGNRPYREVEPVSKLRPSADKSCTKCGACAKICPVGAISLQDIKKADKYKCIGCAACVYACPAGARAFRGLLYKVGSGVFIKKCAEYKKPQWFM